MKLYRITDWSARYENSGSRKVQGPLDWVCLPTKHDGLSYRRLMRRKDGMELYAAWILLVGVAAKCKTRGTLASECGPLSAEDIALKTGGDGKVISRALEVFSSKDIPWLNTTTLPDHPDEPAARTQSMPDTRQDITRQDNSFAASPLDHEPTGTLPDGSPDLGGAFDEFWEAYPARHGRKVGKKAARALFAKLEDEDVAPCIAAAKAYARSTSATEGFAKDAERFLKHDVWRDFLDPAIVEAPSRVLMPHEYGRWNGTTGVEE